MAGISLYGFIFILIFSLRIPSYYWIIFIYIISYLRLYLLEGEDEEEDSTTDESYLKYNLLLRLDSDSIFFESFYEHKSIL